MNCHICNKKYFYYHTLNRQVHSCFDCGIVIKFFNQEIINNINIKDYSFYCAYERVYVFKNHKYVESFDMIAKTTKNNLNIIIDTYGKRYELFKM